MSDTLMGVVFGAIAGVMVYISLDELLPSAESTAGIIAMLGLIAGMMAVSLTALCLRSGTDPAATWNFEQPDFSIFRKM